MTSLVIDTSTEWGVTAFCNEEKTLFCSEIPRGHQNSKYLITSIQEGVLRLGVALSDLASIVVTMGPGSYTGTRIGVAVARTLASFLDVPLIGVCSLHAFARDGGVAILDAKVSGAYIWKEGSPAICPIEKLDQQISEGVELITPHLSALQPKVERHHPGRWNWSEQKPDVEALYHASFKENIGEILYLRTHAFSP